MWSLPSSDSVAIGADGIEDLDRRIALQVGRRDLALLVRVERQDLLFVRVHLDGDLLQVQDDVGDVFHDARQRRELVKNALDFHGRDRGALDRRQKHPAQSVAHRRPEPALERLRIKLSVRGRQRLRVHFEPLRLLKSLPQRHVWSPRSATSLRIQLDDQLLSDRELDVFTLRQFHHPPGEALRRQVQPSRDAACSRRLDRCLDLFVDPALFLDRDLIALPHAERGDRDLLPFTVTCP